MKRWRRTFVVGKLCALLDEDRGDVLHAAGDVASRALVRSRVSRTAQSVQLQRLIVLCSKAVSQHWAVSNLYNAEIKLNQSALTHNINFAITNHIK